jgi:hypothetical protein
MVCPGVGVLPPSWLDAGAPITNTGARQIRIEKFSSLALAALPARFYRSVELSAATPLAACFVASALLWPAPPTVQLTEHFTGPVRAWNWNFGVGSTSVARRPSRRFAAGTCTAALSVQNSTGCAGIQINPGTSGATPPSQVLNLANWKLTLRVSRSGAATEISQPAPKSFSDQYIQADPAGHSVVFTAPCGGVTTSRSSYPRSELREMACGGSTNASWSTTSGSSTMEITEAITHIPVAKPQVIAGQVHDGVSKVI